MRDGWRRIALGDVTRQSVEPVTLSPDEHYSNLGVKWYAQGTFQREPKLGSEIKAKTLFRVRPGQFVYNRLFATEGSFALVAPEDAQTVASNEFPVFDVDSSSVLPEFLELIFQQPQVWAQVSEQCVGTTKSRLRWKEAMFRDFQVWLPSLVEQRRIVDLIAALDAVLTATSESITAAEVLLTRTRDSTPSGRDGHVGDVVRCVVNGVTTSAQEQASGTGIQTLVKASAVQAGEFIATETKPAGDSKYDDRYYVALGDVLMTRINTPERVGQIARVRQPVAGMIRPDLVWRLDLDTSVVRPDYFVHALSGASGRSTVSAAASGTSRSMQQISKGRFLTVPLKIPPLDAQDEYVSRCEATLSAKQALQETGAALRHLRGELLTALLSGVHEIPASYDDLLLGVAA